MRSAARALVALAIAAATVVVPAAPGPAQPAGETCRGLAATIVGTAAADVLTGTTGPDVIVGLDGDDVIVGRAGDDVVCGNGGTDRIAGGRGDDRLLGGRDGLHLERDGELELDVVTGDLVEGGPGDDRIDLGWDARQLTMSWGADVLQLDGSEGTSLHLAVEGGTSTAAGNGHDIITGQASVIVRGSPGPDRIWGTPYDDSITGGAGDDVIRGLAGRDHLQDAIEPGWTGHDILIGDEQDDALLTFNGRDVLMGEAGRDNLASRARATLLGGRGNDHLNVSAGHACVEAHGEAGKDQLRLLAHFEIGNEDIFADLGGAPGGCAPRHPPATVASGIELLYFFYGGGQSGPTWRVRGSSGPDRMMVPDSGGRLVAHLRGGDDWVTGGWGDDVLYGGAGDDFANGRDGFDLCRGFESRMGCESE